MNIIVRDLDPSKVKKIDFQAKKRNMSRQEYLKMILEKLATHEEVIETEEKYTLLTEKVLSVIQQNSIVMNSMNEIINEFSEEE